MNRFLSAELNSKTEKKSYEIIALLFPCIYICRNQAFQLSLLIWGTYLVYLGCSSAEEFDSYGLQFYSSYRLEQLKLSLTQNSPLILEFAILKDGCQLSTNWTNRHGSSITIFPTIPTEINGYSLKLYGNESTDSEIWVQYILQGFNNVSKQWVQIASPNFRKVVHGLRFLHGGIILERDNASVFDFTSTWPLIIGTSVVCILSGICLLYVAAVARMGTALVNRDRISSTVAACMILVATVLAVAGFGHLQAAQAAYAFLPLSLAAVLCGLAGLLFLAPGPAGNGLLMYGVAALVLRAVNECVVFDDCGYFWVSFDYGAAAAVAVGGWLIMHRERVALRAVHAVLPDAAHYDALWEAIAASPETRRQLAALQLLVARVQRPCTPNVRHIAGPRMSPTQASKLQINTSALKLGSVSRPIKCLNQLYSQAILVAPHLHALATEWASASGGDLVGAAIEDDSEGVGLEKWVELGMVKRPQRAAEKALACYGGDISRVIDICRARAWFDTLVGLANCLALVAADQRVVVVRVKNTMLPSELRSWDSLWNAGFRVRGPVFSQLNGLGLRVRLWKFAFSL